MALNSLFCADVPLSNYSLTRRFRAFRQLFHNWNGVPPRNDPPCLNFHCNQGYYCKPFVMWLLVRALAGCCTTIRIWWWRWTASDRRFGIRWLLTTERRARLPETNAGSVHSC